MKKILVYAAILSLLLPAVAYAKAEFSLGGYIKLDTFWDTSQNDSLLLHPIARDNSVEGTHGRFNMRAQESRFNFTIKGPKVFGAVLTGFIEMDFDGTTDSSAVSSSGTWNARLRHAMFRLNWPETELLMGQYWGLFSNWWTEGAEDGPFIPYGSALDRIPQIRLTQKFLSDWSVSGLVALPTPASLTNADPYSTNANNGSSAETPQLQAMVKYDHDWWGKAAYYGHPIPFTATVSAGWQRNISRFGHNNVLAFGQNNYVTVTGNNIGQQYLSPWLVQGALFLPIIPTHTANLAGTASILAQGFVGQGVEVFGIFGGSSNLYNIENSINGVNTFTPQLLNRWGFWAQGQYYFTNVWFANVAYGRTSVYGINRNTQGLLADQFSSMQQVDATLWYRPIEALKFGLQYTFAHTKWLEKTTVNGRIADQGNEHRVEFVGIFYF
jgi:hypothetical protein